MFFIQNVWAITEVVVMVKIQMQQLKFKSFVSVRPLNILPRQTYQNLLEVFQSQTAKSVLYVGSLPTPF